MKINKNSFSKAVLILVLLFISCKKSNPPVVWGTAQIRFVNTVIDSAPYDLYHGTLKLTEDPIFYDEYTGYVEAPAGRSVLWAVNNLTNEAVTYEEATLFNGSSYTFFYAETSENKPFVKGYVNDKSLPVVGNYRVRFLNIAGDLEDKTLTIMREDGANLNSALAFADVPSYYQIPVGEGIKVNITNVEEDDDHLVTTIPGSSFQAGKIYLVWFDTTDGATIDYHILPQD